MVMCKTTNVNTEHVSCYGLLEVFGVFPSLSRVTHPLSFKEYVYLIRPKGDTLLVWDSTQGDKYQYLRIV